MTAEIETVAPSVHPGRAELVAATRELMLAVGTSGLSDAELGEAATRVRALVPDLAGGSLRRPPAPTYDEAVGAPGYHAAEHNPGMPALDMRFEDSRATARITLDDLFQGPVDSVHGGVLSYLMDTLLASLVQHCGLLCVTASLSLDYKARTPVGAPLDLTAWVAETRTRSLRVEGRVAHEGRTTVEAHGVFVKVDSR